MQFGHGQENFFAALPQDCENPALIAGPVP
jgi:hypothetical protein